MGLNKSSDILGLQCSFIPCLSIVGKRRPSLCNFHSLWPARVLINLRKNKKKVLIHIWEDVPDTLSDKRQIEELYVILLHKYSRIILKYRFVHARIQRNFTLDFKHVCIIWTLYCEHVLFDNKVKIITKI